MISFSNQDINFSLKKKLEVRNWARTILEREGKLAGELAFIYCSDEYLLGLNKQYLKHETLTDIITFDYTENEAISGDVFISIERVKENAGLFSKTFDEELGRVMAHGVLHLAGYKDKTTEHKKEMRSKEDLYLPSYPNLMK